MADHLVRRALRAPLDWMRAALASMKAHPRSTAASLVGAVATFLLMAHDGQLPHGSLIGLATVALMVVGLLNLMGVLLPATEDVPSWRSTALGRLPKSAAWSWKRERTPEKGEGEVELEPKWMTPLYTVPAALLTLGILGPTLSYPHLPWVILLSLACLLPSALRRPGLLVFVIVCAIYFPLLGTFSLWDPWETHYGEVAREIISRDDWISLWWAHEGWFWSKPILIFWSEALSFSALGVDCLPDANPLNPEWAVRLPVCLFAVSAVMTVYYAMGKIFGRRAGILCALALATTPHFYMLAHQAITDMYLGANMVMALMMLALALSSDPEKEARSFNLFGRAISLHTLVIGGVLMLALPQAFYLLTRNITFYPTRGFSVHTDIFLHGSAHNAGVPGHHPLFEDHPAIAAFQPYMQGILWLFLLGIFIAMMRSDRREQGLYMTAFYTFCGLAFMGKGIPGFALPGLVAFFYLIASRRWNLLLTGQLRVTSGILIVLVVGFPWYLAISMRHGSGFIDRFLVHDHINRLAAGVHGDTGSIEYFIWQLGYATFPWVALVPAGILAWLWMRRAGDREGAKHSEVMVNRRQTLMLIGLWFFSAFALFSAMITKFHHYIFPAVPAAAIVAGLLLDRFWGEGRADEAGHDEEGAKLQRRARMVTAMAIAAPLLLVIGVGLLFGGLRGVIPESVPEEEMREWILHQGNAALGYVLIALGAGVLMFCGRWLWRDRREAEDSARGRERDLALSVAAGGGAALAAFVGRDLSWVTMERPAGYERLIHLFVYNYARPWPQQFDYRPILTGLAIVAVSLVALAAFRWSRRVAARAFLGASLVMSAWALNIYLVDLAPHWGMKEAFQQYYEERLGPEEPVIAWQMNWKGENFYTGNRVYLFVETSSQDMREWVRENGDRRLYFVGDHGRFSTLQSLFRDRRVEKVTTVRGNNKFALYTIEPEDYVRPARGSENSDADTEERADP